MEDVARLAGVSMITVSRAIREPAKVAPATLARIEAAIRRTGYVPNLTAGSLASSRSRIVGAVVPTIDNSIFAETVRGMSEVLEAAGYQLLLGQTAYRADAEDSLVQAFLGRRVDGMVLTGIGHSPATVRRLRAAAIPVVETWDLTARPIDMLVGFSNRDAGAALGRHLLARGYRRLGFVGGAEERGRSRYAGLAAAVADVPGATVLRQELAAGTSYKDGRAAILRFLELPEPPQACFFGNDALAIGALMECARRGVRVPQDMAIAGFADLDIAAEVTPALTTVHVGSRQIGEEAARLLLARFEGRRVAPRIRDLGFRVVARAST
ncbi:MAG: LacI family DNA-binding transcriptional regulator [Burkholderiales bacterium]|nr:LacI family DNA-binding transcriptional regulator [Burkholderiales bacterium]